MNAENSAAKGLIDSEEFSLVVVADSGQIYKFSQSGVKSLIGLYEKSPAALKGASVFDRVVGKAAAALLVLGGAKSVYGKIMSEAGKDFLESHGIDVSYKKQVNRILNRTGDGYCPIEESCLTALAATEAYRLIKEKLLLL